MCGGTGGPLGAYGTTGRPALQPGSGNQSLAICLRLGSFLNGVTGHLGLYNGHHGALL
jgi:hypothetical protein